MDRGPVLSAILLTPVIYLPCHLFEEAVGDMPRWMFDHRWLPFHMTHGHWMANNLFLYYPMLLAAVALYVLNSRLTCCGIGVLVWGIINFGDHAFYTIKDRAVSPGLLTGIAFLVNSVFGLACFIKSEAFAPSALIFGILIGACLFGLPIALCRLTYSFFDRYIR